jgi:hypothetical protein
MGGSLLSDSIRRAPNVYRMTEAELGTWMRALRSGQYQQAQKQLRYADQTGEYHCCLSVLAHVVPDRIDEVGYPAPALGSEDVVIPLNDHGPAYRYARVLADLESCPEVYITAV